MNIQLKPLSVRKIDVGPGDRAHPPEDVGHARRRLFLQNSAGHPHRRTAEQRAVPVHAADAGSRQLAQVGAESSATPFDASRNWRTSVPTSRTRACRRNVVIDRDTASRLGLTAQAVD